MNLSNAYLLSQDLTESTSKLQSHQNDLKGIKTSQTIFTVATFFIYFSFTSVIFAGVTVWNLQGYIFDNYTNAIGMVWALVTVFCVPLALSLAKHFNYKAIARNSLERGHRGQLIIHAIIALALISGLYYEAISSSSNLQAKAFHSVENSKAGQSIMNTTVTSSASGMIAGQLADAEFKLVACQRRLKDGSVTDCNNSQARVNSLKQQAQAERESVASANVTAIGAKQAALSKERDEHALPAAKYAAELVNMSNDAGTMIIVIIAALFFELIHITTIFNEARALRGIDTYAGMLKNQNADYFKATGKTFDSGDFRDNRTIDLSDKPLNVPMDNAGADFDVRTKGKPYQDSDGFGFIPKTASRFKWQESESTPLPAKPEKPFGFIPARSSSTPTDKPVMRESNGFRQSQEQREMVAKLAADDTGSTYRNELKSGSRQFRDVPLDAPATPSPKVPEGIQNTPPSRPSAEGGTTLQPKGAEGGDSPKVPEGADAKKATLTDGLYERWVSAINAGQCAASVKQSWSWVQKQIAGSQAEKLTFNNREITAVVQLFFMRAMKDGHARLNPKYTNPKCGFPKYLWIA